MLIDFVLASITFVIVISYTIGYVMHVWLTVNKGDWQVASFLTYNKRVVDDGSYEDLIHLHNLKTNFKNVLTWETKDGIPCVFDPFSFLVIAIHRYLEACEVRWEVKATKRRK